MNLVIFLQAHFYLFLVFTTLLGLCIGSFINVVIHRLPIMLDNEWRQQTAENESEATQQATFNLAKPDSHCPACQHKIALWHNIPLVSYLFLKGKCAYCAQRFSVQYFMIELITGIISLIVAWYFGVSWLCAGALLFTWFLIPLVMIDLKHQLLPDAITLLLLWLGLAFNLLFGFISLQDAVIGAIAGYGFLWLFMNLYRLITGKIGMGHGDFKLLAAIGAWCGWQVLPFVIVAAALLGSIVGISYLMATRQKSNTPIAFGPYLAVAGWVALLFHPWVSQFLLIY